MLCKNKVLHLYQRKELIITTTKIIKDMKTKEQVIEFVATELKNGNSVVMATLGNGGNGLTLLQGDCSEFIGELNTYSFDGKIKGCLDITESEYTEEASEIYQFSGNDGYKVQILTY